MNGCYRLPVPACNEDDEEEDDEARCCLLLLSSSSSQDCEQSVVEVSTQQQDGLGLD